MEEDSGGQGRSGQGDGLGGELRHLASDLGGLLASATHLRIGNFSSVKDELMQGFKSARESFISIRQSFMTTMRSNADVANRYVRENPWKSVGYASAAGLFVGMLLMRPRKSAS